jgi:hypothetical protein
MRALSYGNVMADDAYFSQEDHALFEPDKAYSAVYDGERQGLRDKFLALHDVLYPAIKRRGWDLHPHWHPPNIVSTWYIGRIQNISFMKLRYLRSKGDVRRVEQMMGIPRPLDRSETQYTKHPMIDVRLDRHYLAVELLLTDQAWWDAQNFKRKVERDPAERDRLIGILADLGNDYVFGGWPDSSEPQLITTAADLADEEHLLDWLSRFSPGYDWLRLGIWYDDHADFRLAAKRLAEEVIHRFSQLYPVYQFLLWTPENSYRQI